MGGDAGDEAFAGYNRYRYAKIARLLRSLPASELFRLNDRQIEEYIKVGEEAGENA